MMIHLLSKQVANFPVLAKETLRRLVLKFCDQKSSAVKCQILNLAFNVYQQRGVSGEIGEEEESKDGEAVTEQMLRYVLKVAQLDENLIVKQKARFMSHVLEYKDSIDLADLAQDEPEQAKPSSSNTSAMNVDSQLTSKLDLLDSSISNVDQTTMELATTQQIKEAEQARSLGFQEVDDSELLFNATDGMASTGQSNSLQPQSISSESMRHHNAAIEHSKL